MTVSAPRIWCGSARTDRNPSITIRWSEATFVSIRFRPPSSQRSSSTWTIGRLAASETPRDTIAFSKVPACDSQTVLDAPPTAPLPAQTQRTTTWRIDRTQISLPKVVADRHVFNQYIIRTARRNELKSALQERGVGTEIYYPVPMHLQECFSSLGYRPGAFPESESAANETLALPIYPELTDEQAEYVVQSVSSFFSAGVVTSPA